MSDISVDQKLKLIEQVRSQYHRDQYDLLHREQILYGRTASDPSDEPMRGSFRIRLAAAVLLFVLIVLFDQKDGNILGITTSQVFQSIENDYFLQMEEIINGSQFISGY